MSSRATAIRQVEPVRSRSAANRVLQRPGQANINLIGTPVDAVLALQRSAGNGAVCQAMASRVETRWGEPRQSVPKEASLLERTRLTMLQRQSPPPVPAAAPTAPVGRRTGRPIADLEKEFRGLISSARGLGYNVAADNLEHFLIGHGAKRSVPLGWLRSFGVVTDAEVKNHERFESQLDDRAKATPDGGTGALVDFWDARISAGVSSELFYASGISQLKSSGTFSLSRTGSIVTITGTVNQRWFDPYNWNPGSSAYIPGHGVVSDDVGLDLKDAGVAHDYLLENLYTQTVTGTYRFRRFIWNTSSYTWSGP